ncbi:MAG: GNAT family N-acetyltransferase [Bacteroidetes bacterium]|nr:GNAT family N-acetyltransferase [Bacteroidota bacterium]MBK9671848.1 GNAT family N-acetyltransferase [Bacteroidota bacterium]MBK9798578.1 GNAT family N-acetyltransferase [Bacteroidota bacterium]MBP6413844.1 GNAT family N-acetyltransferase [Bacteroidia bacterium]
MNIELKKATADEIPLIQQLSESIWRQHYIDIISKQQIEYMLAKMYSTEKLQQEINSDLHTYFIAYLKDKPLGYIAISKESDNKIMLNKFYLLQEQRFHGLGKKIFELVFSNYPQSDIQLFVNRQNFKSVNFYFKMGFKIADVIDNHFGEGYYMNDFFMVKKTH